MFGFGIQYKRNSTKPNTPNKRPLFSCRARGRSATVTGLVGVSCGKVAQHVGPDLYNGLVVQFVFTIAQRRERAGVGFAGRNFRPNWG